MNGRFTIFKYDIDACWYGSRISGALPEQDSFKEALTGLKKWISSVSSIAETVVGDEAFYVKECACDGVGRYVIILWLPISRDATSTALDISSKPGRKARIQQRNYPPDFKPGCPLYYYVDVSNMNVYVLRPDTSTIIGREIFEDLMRNVMMFHVGAMQQVLKTSDGSSLVVGDKDASPKKSAVFRMVQSSSPVKVNEIISRASDIKKMVHMVPLNSATREFMLNFWSAFDLSVKSRIEDVAKNIKYEVNVDFDEDSLRKLIDHQQKVGGLERIGFVVRDNGSSRTLWADKTGNKQFVIPKLKPIKGVYSGAEMLKYIPQFI